MNVRARLALLCDGPLAEEWDTGLVGGDPLGFPGYLDALRAGQAVTGLAEAVLTGRGAVSGRPVAVIAGAFDVLGGSMGVAVGERVARAFERATAAGLPVVSLLASGGARMQEGMVSLAQMAKTVVAADAHGAAGLLHVAVCTNPTTGGVYASYGSRADVLLADAGATIGFAGPRVAEAALGGPLPPGSHRAESALAAGLVDAVVAPEDQREFLATLLGALEASPRSGGDVERPHLMSPGWGPRRHAERRQGRSDVTVRREPPTSAWDAVTAARAPDRSSGADAVAGAVTDFTRLRGDRCGGDDPVVVAGLGRLLGRPVGVVALDRHTGSGRPGPAGYRLAVRAARLAERLGLPLVTLVDTPGADPGASAEAGGVARAIADTFAVVLGLRTPVVSACIGEGGSGGALALACGDVLLMQATSVFSVIGPEAAAAILYRDPSRAPDLAPALRITARDVVDLGIADRVVPDGLGALPDALADALAGIDPGAVPALRRERWRRSGNRFLA